MCEAYKENHCRTSFVLESVLKKTKNGTDIPVIVKNNISIHQLGIFEDICLRNREHTGIIAIEINGKQLTYGQFFIEVEKYISAFSRLGVKERSVVTLCLPVCVEFICSYFALSTMGAVCNATNVMFLLSEGAQRYIDDRDSDVLICNDEYYGLLAKSLSFRNSKLKTLIIQRNSTYSETSQQQKDTFLKVIPDYASNVISTEELLQLANPQDTIHIVEYDERRPATFTYTSGTTGTPKCTALSDLAPLFLVASHDYVDRPNEIPGDRSLVTIPLQHPTGLFYSMVLQLAQGKTLVLEPRYDKTLFSQDIINLNIQHAVQAKPFYAQLIQDKKDGKIKRGDFDHFKCPYSGGEGVPLAVCKEINEVLHFAGCKTDFTIGYGRSEEGSITMGAYDIVGRKNSVGTPLPGIKVKLVKPGTKEALPLTVGTVGEIQISTPVAPIGHCYIGKHNRPSIPDGSYLDAAGDRWARPNDIATIIRCEGGTDSYLVLGRADDYAEKSNQLFYLFDIKEKISEMSDVQECEVLKMKSTDHHSDYIVLHMIPVDMSLPTQKRILSKVETDFGMIDAVKFHSSFGINATSGKCDREAMSQDVDGYRLMRQGNIYNIQFKKTDSSFQYRSILE